MRKAWVFFKLRVIQLKYDKTALFFSYIFPVLLLVGIGLANQREESVTLYYKDSVQSPESKHLLTQLSNYKLIDLQEFTGSAVDIDEMLEKNEIYHFFNIESQLNGELQYEVRHGSIDKNELANTALNGLIDRAISTHKTALKVTMVGLEKKTSYLEILLPGLIGMTLLIIGLNGFGNVLIEEEHRGLFKNIKTISISPIPFLSGLFLSRLLVCYSVAILLFVLGVVVFDMTTKVNYFWLFIVVTLGTFAFLGLGLMLAAICPSVSAFSGVVNFVQLPFVVLGGVFFSITAFPDWLQFIANLIPLTSMNSAMQKLMFESELGGGLQIQTELMVLMAWCLVTLFVSYKKFKW